MIRLNRTESRQQVEVNEVCAKLAAVEAELASEKASRVALADQDEAKTAQIALLEQRYV